MYNFSLEKKQIMDYRYKWKKCFYEWMTSAFQSQFMSTFQLAENLGRPKGRWRSQYPWRRKKNKMLYLLSNVKKYKFFSFKRRSSQFFFFLIFPVDKHAQNFASLFVSLECFKKNTAHISYGYAKREGVAWVCSGPEIMFK